MKDGIAPLASHVAQCRRDEIPAATLAFQKTRVLDNLGTLIAGRRADAVAELCSLKQQQGGAPETQVLTQALRLPAAQAAFLNSVMARAHDFCDVLVPGYHPSSTDVPVAMALAEKCGASGIEMLAALALGQDIGQRINLAAQANGFLYRGFDSDVLALFSGTAVAARLLKIDAAQTANAFGLAFNHGVGTFQMYTDKTHAVRIAQGTITRGCVDAALMASCGLTGVKEVLDGREGFFACYAPAESDRTRLTDALGQRFEGEAHTCFKLYPSCGVTLALTDAAIALRDEIGFAAQVSHIHISACDTLMNLCGQAFEANGNVSVNAMFSAQYVAASALLRGRSTLFEFTSDAVLADDVQSLMRKTNITCDSSLPGYDRCLIEIERSDGRRFHRTAAFGRGWPQNPATPSEIEAKFRSNVAFAAAPWLSARTDDLIAEVDALDRAPSLQPLISLLTPP